MTATFADRRWVFPSGDCRLLPVANTTAELLAAYIGEPLAGGSGRRCQEHHPRPRRARRVRRADRRVGMHGYAAHLSLATGGKLCPTGNSSQAALSTAPIRRADGLRRLRDQCRSPLLLASTRRFAARHVGHSQRRRSADDPARGGGRQLMSKLEPKQVEQVSIEIARTRAIAADEQERVIKEFTEANPSHGRPRRRLGAGQVADPKSAGQQRGGRARQYPPVDRGDAVRLSAARRQPEPADLHHRRASANDRADHVAPAGQLRRRDPRRPARGAAALRRAADRHDGPDQPRNHSRGRKRPRAPDVERDEPELRERRRRRGRGRNAQRLRPGHRAGAARKPGRRKTPNWSTKSAA